LLCGQGVAAPSRGCGARPVASCRSAHAACALVMLMVIYSLPAKALKAANTARVVRHRSAVGKARRGGLELDARRPVNGRAKKRAVGSNEVIGSRSVRVLVPTWLAWFRRG
jgi:hypothetical protein